jgi:hypothetical protein
MNSQANEEEVLYVQEPNENEQEEDKGLFGRIKEVAGFRDAPKVEKEIILFERFE